MTWFNNYYNDLRILKYIQNSRLRYEYTRSGEDLMNLLNAINNHIDDVELINFFIDDGLHLATPKVLKLITKNYGVNIKVILDLIKEKDYETVKWIQKSGLRIN
jgi:hypothetical protein